MISIGLNYLFVVFVVVDFVVVLVVVVVVVIVVVVICCFIHCFLVVAMNTFFSVSLCLCCY